MASLINAYDLDEAIEENLSAYEIAKKFDISYGSIIQDAGIKDDIDMTVKVSAK